MAYWHCKVGNGWKWGTNLCHEADGRIIICGITGSSLGYMILAEPIKDTYEYAECEEHFASPIWPFVRNKSLWKCYSDTEYLYKVKLTGRKRYTTYADKHECEQKCVEC